MTVQAEAGIGGAPQHRRLVNAAHAVLLGATLAAVLFIRLHHLQLPLERDEGEYAYAGQLLLGGIPPYQLAYNMKFPGTYAAYAALMTLFGQSTAGIHLGLLCVNLATAACLFLIARRILGAAAGTLAATFYTALSVSPWVAGLSAHATHFVVLAVLAGTLVLLWPAGTSRLSQIVIAGLFFGAAILMKQPGAFFLPFGCLVVALKDWRAAFPFPRVLLRTLAFLGSAVVPIVITMLLLWRAGVFPRFWFWTIEYARAYGTLLSPAQGAQLFAAQFPRIVGAGWPIWAIAAAGVVLITAIKRMRGIALVLIAFLVCSAAAVCPGFYFREHYFILVLPAVALLAAAAITVLDQIGMVVVGPALAAAAIALPLYVDRDLLFRRSPVSLSEALYWPNPFAAAIRVADFLRDRTQPLDTIAVLGSEPEIYFYANRHSATGYIYTYALMEPHPRAPAMQREMAQEIERAAPKYVVVVGVEPSWLRRPASDQFIFNWANDYCTREFTLVGMVNLIAPADTRLSLPVTEIPESPGENYLLVYERKATIGR